MADPRLDAHASGVFLNRAGDVLTARHAVAGCGTVYVLKDGRVDAAQIRAVDPQLDLAVLSTGLKPQLAATFQRVAPAVAGASNVFAEAHSVLDRLPERTLLRSNAMTVPDDGELLLLSAVRPGASGSGVLGGDGLLRGIVVERVALGSGATTRALSSLAAGSRQAGPSRVRAVSAASIKDFLTRHGIGFAESDNAQLGPLQSPAARAWTLSAGVICGR